MCAMHVTLAAPKTLPARQVSGPEGGASPPVNPLAGQITSELIDSMRSKIQEALEATRVDVTDMSGDGQHVSIDVVSPRFEGLGSMKRHGPFLSASVLQMQELALHLRVL
jgi:stress-induced morphogen